MKSKGIYKNVVLPSLTQMQDLNAHDVFLDVYQRGVVYIKILTQHFLKPNFLIDAQGVPMLFFRCTLQLPGAYNKNQNGG